MENREKAKPIQYFGIIISFILAGALILTPVFALIWYIGKYDLPSLKDIDPMFWIMAVIFFVLGIIFFDAKSNKF